MKFVNARAVPPGLSSSVRVHELGPYFPAIFILLNYPRAKPAKMVMLPDPVTFPEKAT